MRIILADDQVEVRSALRIVLEHESGLSVVGEAAEMGSLLLQAKENNPDVVLLDWELARLRISDLVPVLKELYPGLKVVALSGRPEAAKAALAAGADAFVSKGDQPERLVNTLQDIKQKMLISGGEK